MPYRSDVLDALRKFAPQSGDPVTFIAAGLVESNLDPNAIGDGGHSGGLLQENDAGRGHGIPMSNRLDPYANAQRGAREFRSFYDRGARGAQLALRAQRPSDPQYASKVLARMPEAKRLWAEISGGGPVTTTPSATGATPGAPPELDLTNLAQRALLARRDDESLTHALGQQYLLNKLATKGGVATKGGAVAGPSVPSRAPKVPRGVGGLLSIAGKLIGRPYEGTHRLGNWQSDNAIDLAAPVGTPIYAVADGVIGPRFGSLGSSNPRMAGLRLTLESSGNAFYYAHMSRFAPGIKPGASVRKGDLLGFSGSANGVPHLHFGVQHGDPRRWQR
jgi:murein DD-endopeptidase MepM/ murein hydrolase activator NlpD